MVLRINSPGGSPVQAQLIYDEMRRLRTKYPDIPLYAVVEDICASGGYFVAVGADRIYVDKASIVGSIGVLMDGFGFTGLMDKLGVERRLITAGENKGMLDPFSPVDPKDSAARRGDARRDPPAVHRRRAGGPRQAPEGDARDLFSGLIWTGQKSVELGLADALGSLEYVARDVVKAEDIVDYTQKESIAEKLAQALRRGRGERLDGVRGARLTLSECASSRNTAGRRPIAALRAAPLRRSSCVAMVSLGSVRSAATQSRVCGAARLEQRGEQRVVAIRRLDEDLRSLLLPASAARARGCACARLSASAGR